MNFSTDSVSDFIIQNKLKVSVALGVLVLVLVAFVASDYYRRKKVEYFSTQYAIASHLHSNGKNSEAIEMLQDVFNGEEGEQKALSGVKLILILSDLKRDQDLGNILEILLPLVQGLENKAFYYALIYQALLGRNSLRAYRNDILQNLEQASGDDLFYRNLASRLEAERRLGDKTDVLDKDIEEVKKLLAQEG